MGATEGLRESPACSLSQGRFAMLYLSVPCAHIIKHKSTDLEHGMTEQQPVNNREQMSLRMSRHRKTGRG